MDYLKRIFIAISFTTAIYVLTGTDCPEQVYQIGSSTFTWRATHSSDLWIASDCLDQEKRLIFRKCEGNDWTPNISAFQDMCRYENAELPSSDCPTTFESIEVQETIVCVRKKGLEFDFTVDRSACIQDSIFSMDLTIEEQTKLIRKLTQTFTDDHSLFVMEARWRYPSREILKNVYYENVELHDVRCGRFGLPQLNQVNTAVNCNDKCENICLYLNATAEPFSQTIDECSEYVIAKPKKSFLHTIGCPEKYYRIENDYVENSRASCFSIETFSPIAVQDFKANVKCSDKGTIMNMNNRDDLFIFRQLSEQLELTDGNYCLFSVISNQIMKYSDWDSSYASQIPFNFNWDKTMNYSRIIDPGAESYLAIKPNGQWTWADDSVSCIVCMVHSPLPLSELQLKYNILERSLELEVTDEHLLFKEKSSDLGFICFSVFRDVYTANLTVSPIIGYGKYLIEDVGMGQYWCTGHSVIYRYYRSTGPAFFAYGIWFSFEVIRKCTTNCSFDADVDLKRFIELFKASNGYVSVKNFSIIKYDRPESVEEYSFIALLSLTLHSSVKDSSVPNLVNLTDYQLETAFIFEKLNNTSNDMIIKSSRSTEYCLPESTTSINAIIWRVARMGETVSISPLCSFQENYSAITRTCSGDSVNGSHWMEDVDTSLCYTVVSKSLLETYTAFKDFSQTTDLLEYLEGFISQKCQMLLPLDVFLMSKILQKVTVIITDIQYIFSIYNTLMQVDDKFLKISSSSNSVNVLLDAFDNILLGHIKSSIIGSYEYQQYGNSSIKSTLIETFVIHPIISGVSGIGVYRGQNSSELNSTTYSLRYIHPNETLYELASDRISDEDLIVGAYLSTETLTSFQTISIVMTVFFNDSIFQSVDMLLESGIYQTNGKLISITILLNDTVNLPTAIPVFFESNQTNASTCGVSSFTTINGPGWSSNGCTMGKMLINNFQRFALCECKHFTYFTRLSDSEFSKTHNKSKALKIFSVITSSFSFFGTFGIFLTAAISQAWRQRLSSKMFIHFSTAITLEMVFMIFIKFDVAGSNTVACVALGTMINYSVLAMYVWTLIFVYFQLKLNDAVPIVSHFLLKFTICGWTVPLLPVIIILIVDYLSYIPINKDELNFCYPTGWALYVGLVTPIFLIFLFNSIIFISVVSLYKGSNQEDEAMTNHNKNEIALPQILLFALVCLTLGLTCIFGLSSEILPSSYTLFSSLFCITATIQGVVLFLYFIVFDPNVRSIWENLIIREDRDRPISLITWHCSEI